MNTLRKISGLSLLLVAFSSGAARVAYAQGDSSADALYKEGRAAAIAKNWEVACKKFQESHDREPAPGTLLNLADCEENRGLLTNAFSHFESASRLFKAGDERVNYAKQRMAALDRRIPRLTLRLSPSTPTGANVSRDGVQVDAALLGRPASVNPGEHVVVVRAPGRTDMKSTVRLAEGESRELELSAGTPVESGVAAAAAPAAASGALASSSTAGTPAAHPALQSDTGAADSDSGHSTTRTLGLGLLVGGGAALALGVTGGIITLGKKSTVDSHCTPGCDQTGTDAQSSGKTWSTIGTIGVIAGVAGLGAGTYFVLSSKPNSSQTTVGAAPLPGGGSLQFASTF